MRFQPTRARTQRSWEGGLSSGLRLLEERETRLQALRRALIEGESSGITGPLDMEKIKKRAREDAGLAPS